MNGDSPLFDQADALMRRRRVFLAGAAAIDADSAAPPDDLPLLTEVVDLEPVPPAAAEAVEALARAHLARLLDERRTAVALELETWLDEQLPQLVIRAMDGITDHLVTVLTLRAREDLLPRLDAILQPVGKADDSEEHPE